MTRGLRYWRNVTCVIGRLFFLSCSTLSPNQMAVLANGDTCNYARSSKNLKNFNLATKPVGASCIFSHPIVWITELISHDGKIEL